MRWMLVLIPMLLAGCFGHCEYAPTEASWTDDSLFDAVDATVIPAEGIAVSLDHVALGFIVHSVDPMHEGVRYAHGAIQAEVWDNATLPQMVAGARAILENATTMPAAEIDDHLDALLASRSQGHGHMVHIAGDGRSIDSYRHVVAIDGDLLLANLGYEGDGRVPIQQGPWRGNFNVDEKRLLMGAYELRVHAFGDALMGHRGAELTPDEIVVADVQRVLRENGLPEPASVQVSGGVC